GAAILARGEGDARDLVPELRVLGEAALGVERGALGVGRVQLRDLLELLERRVVAAKAREAAGDREREAALLEEPGLLARESDARDADGHAERAGDDVRLLVEPLERRASERRVLERRAPVGDEHVGREAIEAGEPDIAPLRRGAGRSSRGCVRSRP